MNKLLASIMLHTEGFLDSYDLQVKLNITEEEALEIIDWLHEENEARKYSILYLHKEKE